MSEITRRLFLASASIFLLTGATRSNTAAVEMSYGNTALQRFDLYPIPGLVKAPILVFIHGGGWAIGDKSHVDVLPEYAHRHGALLASINYRLVPAVTAKECAEDAAAAVAKIRDIAKDNGGDEHRIFLVGHSAGAQIAALIATDPAYLAPHKMKPSDLAGVVLLDGGTYDMTDGVKADKRRAAGDTQRAEIYSKAVGGQEAALSPILKLRSGELYPPFLIFHVARRADSGSQSRMLGAKLISVGGSALVISAENKVHATIKKDFGVPGDPVGERSAAFFSAGSLEKK